MGGFSQEDTTVRNSPLHSFLDLRSNADYQRAGTRPQSVEFSDCFGEKDGTSQAQGSQMNQVKCAAPRLSHRLGCSVEKLLRIYGGWLCRGLVFHACCRSGLSSPREVPPIVCACSDSAGRNSCRRTLRSHLLRSVPFREAKPAGQQSDLRGSRRTDRDVFGSVVPALPHV